MTHYPKCPHSTPLPARDERENEREKENESKRGNEKARVSADDFTG